MKLTNKAVVNILSILDYYADKRLPQKISYAITRNIILLRKDYECYNNEMKKLLFRYDKYIVKNESNKQIMLNDEGFPIISEEKSKDFNSELEILLNIEINVDIYTISMDIFDYNDNERYDILSAKDIIALQSVLCIQKGSDNNEILD